MYCMYCDKINSALIVRCHNNLKLNSKNNKKRKGLKLERGGGKDLIWKELMEGKA